MKKTLLVLAAAAAFVPPAIAEMAVPGGPPRMEFSTVPGSATAKLQHEVLPYRIFDRMVITVNDPVYCGQDAANPRFSIEGNRLLLNYELTEPVHREMRCLLVSQFVIANVPHRDLVVLFAGGSEPYTVAALDKCPAYAPRSSDVWECLVPESSLQ